MYNHYFHFTEQPFSIAPDPHFMYMSARHQEGLAHLLFGINRGGGFVALTGEVGTGKTTLCHCLLQQLPGDIDLALILNPKLNALELLAAICDELGITHDQQRPTLKKLTDALNRHLLANHADGKRTVLLIDEAQNLSLEVLEQIRLLTNLETSKTKLLQIILVGQPELKQLLKRQELRQLNQRITARYHLLPLSLEETRAYIRHRLTVCNGNPELFKSGAIKKIYKFSAGVPRVINILCDRALLGAYSTNAVVVTPDIVRHAADEVLAESERGAPRLGTLVSLIALGCLVTAIYVIGFQHPPASGRSGKTGAAKMIAPTATAKPSVVMQPIGRQMQPAPLETIIAQPKIDFATWINNPDFTLPAATQKLLNIWGKAHSPLFQAGGCQEIEVEGLNCLYGKASWQELLAMNRPVILEFFLPDGAKRYTVLTGIGQQRDRVQVHGGQVFALTEMLSRWNGYYLSLWKSPRPGMKAIYPGQSSTHVDWLRQQLNVINGIQETVARPQFFDAALKRRVLEFQRRHHLLEDGIAGAQTLIYLDNETGPAGSPQLKTID